MASSLSQGVKRRFHQLCIVRERAPRSTGSPGRVRGRPGTSSASKQSRPRCQLFVQLGCSFWSAVRLASFSCSGTSCSHVGIQVSTPRLGSPAQANRRRLRVQWSGGDRRALGYVKKTENGRGSGFTPRSPSEGAWSCCLAGRFRQDCAATAASFPH